MRMPRRLRRALPSAGRPLRTLSISPHSLLLALGCRAQVPPEPGESGDRGLRMSRADKALASHRPPDVSRELQLLSLLCKAGLLPAAIASACPRLRQGPPFLPRAEPARSYPLLWHTPDGLTLLGPREAGGRAEPRRPGLDLSTPFAPSRHPPCSWAVPPGRASRCLLPTVNLP